MTLPPMPPKKARSGRPKAPALGRLTANTWVGTDDLVMAVVKESTRQAVWRPVRASVAMAKAADDLGSQGVWMTGDEFAAWVKRFFPNHLRLRDMLPAVGISKLRRLAIVHGAAVSKQEALAMAHYAAGLPDPLGGDHSTESFAAWFLPRFGGVERVARVIGASPASLGNKLRGYDIEHGARVRRSVDIGLARALDWTWRMGPFSPYGERLPAPAFPGQPEGL